MKNNFTNIYIPIAILGLFFYAGIVKAEENETEDRTPTLYNGEGLKIDQEFNQKRIDNRLKMGNFRKDDDENDDKDDDKGGKKNEIEKYKKEMRGEIDQKKSEMLKEILKKRKEFELKKESLEKENEQKKEEAEISLKKTLSVIKDEKKKTSVQNISNIINNTNKNTETRFTNTVNSVENVLVSVKSRTEKVQATGADISLVTANITAAEALIAEARTAISVQSAKVYTIDVSDPTKVKEIMKSTRDTFNTDIKTLQEKVKNARDAVKKAADSLKKVAPKTDSVVAPTTTETTN